MATSEPVLFIKSKVGSPGELGDCPFCHRVLLTLEAKHVPYKKELVDLDNKPQWLLDASGGKVPVIRYEENGPLIPDSDVIVVQLEEKYPQPSTKSSVPPEIGAKLFPSFRGFLMGPAAEAAEKEAAFLGELKAINAYLESTGGPLFGGDAINATDAAVAPKLYHAEVALKHYKGWTIPAELGAVHRYLAAIKALPAWKSVDYGTDAIIKGWDRHFAQAH